MVFSFSNPKVIVSMMLATNIFIKIWVARVMKRMKKISANALCPHSDPCIGSSLVQKGNCCMVSIKRQDQLSPVIICTMTFTLKKNPVVFARNTISKVMLINSFW